jgi:hypothetical protein
MVTPVINYTARDYASIRTEFIGYIKANFPKDWTDFFDSNIGIAMVDIVAMGYANLSYQLDKMTNESFLPTLQLRESLIKIVETLGYPLSTAVSASIEVDAYINSPVVTNILIAKGTLLYDLNGVVFEVDDNYTILAGNTTPRELLFAGVANATFTNNNNTVVFSSALDATVLPGFVIKGNGTHTNEYRIQSISDDRMSLTLFTAWAGATETVTYDIIRITIGLVQGQSFTESFISDGSANQKFVLTNTPFIKGSQIVTVNSSEWNFIENLIFAQSTNKYELLIDSVDKATVIFGDNLNGNIPPNGAAIDIYYRTGGGVQGNLAIGGINTTLSGDAGGGITIQVFIQNPYTRGSGGSDRETIDHARIYIPRWVRTNDRAVTGGGPEQDYDTLASTFSDPTYGAIAKARSVLHTNNVPLESNIIYVYVWTKSGDSYTSPSPGLRTALETYLNAKKVVGTYPVVLNGANKAVDLNINYKVNVSYSSVTVTAALNAAINSFFTADSLSPGDTLYLSQLYDALQDVVGVDYLLVTNLTGNVTSGVNEILVKGTVTLNQVI